MSTHRKTLLFGALTLTLYICYRMSSAQDSNARPIAEPIVEPPLRTAPATQGQAMAALPLEQLQRDEQAVGERNPFASKSWRVEAPPPPPPPPPPSLAPVLPVMPFTYAGKLEEDGNWVVYLNKGQDHYAVRKGDTFDTNYRLEGIDQGKLVILYLPSATQLLLPIPTEQL